MIFCIAILSAKAHSNSQVSKNRFHNNEAAAGQQVASPHSAKVGKERILVGSGMHTYTPAVTDADVRRQSALHNDCSITDDRIHFFVKTLNGGIRTVSGTAEQTLQQVLAIHALSTLPCFIYKHQSVSLDISQTILQCGIASDVTVRVTARLAGGSIDKFLTKLPEFPKPKGTWRPPWMTEKGWQAYREANPRLFGTIPAATSATSSSSGEQRIWIPRPKVAATPLAEEAV